MLNDLPMCVSGGADGLVRLFDLSNPETEKMAQLEEKWSNIFGLKIRFLRILSWKADLISQIYIFL